MTLTSTDHPRSDSSSALLNAVHRLTRLLADAQDTDSQLRATLETAIEATGSAASASFTVTTGTLTSQTIINITAKANGVSKVGKLTLNP